MPDLGPGPTTFAGNVAGTPPEPVAVVGAGRRGVFTAAAAAPEYLVTEATPQRGDHSTAKAKAEALGHVHQAD